VEEAAVPEHLRQRSCQQGLARAGSALQQDSPQTNQFAIEKQIDLLHQPEFRSSIFYFRQELRKQGDGSRDRGPISPA
jgi:hypothetical protein